MRSLVRIKPAFERYFLTFSWYSSDIRWSRWSFYRQFNRFILSKIEQLFFK